MDYWMKKLNLQAHPEGGYFVETYASNPKVSARSFSGETEEVPTMTGIYYLLGENDVSRLHNVSDADEMWHFYDGDPIIVVELEWKQDENKYTVHQTKVGNPLLTGDRHSDAVPSHVVPAGRWFGAVPAEKCSTHPSPERKGYSLAGCTCSPGFTFSRFKIGEKSFAREVCDRVNEEPLPVALKEVLPH
eukprot:gb/GECG01010622.1/.p1 GENE.gb/GECG01010622.1/~~gb/GECG01010622.1/.p1  ORF type:complete len:189 (+),score=20.65 gb/GECG01010622.1/:1-567(+)